MPISKKSLVEFFNKSSKKIKLAVIVAVFVIFSVSALLTGLTYTSYAVEIVDGQSKIMVYTMESDPQSILKEQNITLNKDDQIVFSGFKNDEATLSIKRFFNIKVFVDNSQRLIKVSSFDTVETALKSAKITLGKDDLLNLNLEKLLSPTDQIKIKRVSIINREVKETLPFKTIRTETDTLVKNATYVEVKGVNGLKVINYEDKYIDGKLFSSVLKANNTLSSPVDEKVLVGTTQKTGTNKYSLFKPLFVSLLTPETDFILDENMTPIKYTKKLTGKAVAYSSKNPKAGTASGLMKAMPGAVAVNPEIIPYGSKLFIKTANNKFIYGYAIAADTGAFIHNENAALVDLFFGTYEESKRFGAKAIEVYILE